MPNLLRVRLSLKGRPIRTYTFNKKIVNIGRDPASDIFLDNTGVSREHARIERTPGGYLVQDLGSANGTTLNSAPIQNEGYIANDDVLQIGKFSLWVAVESDRRERDLLGGKGAPPVEGTMVLDGEQLMKVQAAAAAAPLDEEEVKPRSRRPQGIARSTCVAAAVASFSLGLVVGAVAALYFFSG